MISEAKDVSAFLQEVPGNRKEALTKLRQLCKEILKGYKESMAYKMPSYEKDGTVAVAFNSRKNYICLYFLNEQVMQANEELISGLNHGKACIRYPNPKGIDFEIITKLLEDTAKSTKLMNVGNGSNLTHTNIRCSTINIHPDPEL